MSRGGKTWKDQKDKKSERGVRDPRPAERGGRRNLIREAEEEMGYGDDFTEEEDLYAQCVTGKDDDGF